MGLFDWLKNKTLSALDENMNKEFFVLKINILLKGKNGKNKKEKYECYIYPTNNWVEIHCFKKVNFITKEYDVNFRYVPVEEAGHSFSYKTEDYGGSRIKSLWAIFNERIFSFIIPRDKVFGDASLIECTPSKDDFQRWKDWHPKDDFHKELWIKDIECFWKDSHQGEPFIHCLDIESGKLKMY